MKLQSDFALLDVKRGRARLAKEIKSGPRIPVVIHGWIDHQWGDDDGTSIEFAVDVTKVEVGERSQ